MLLISFQLNSQRNEIGFLFGGSNYIGDVGPTTYIDPVSYGTYSYGILYRNNFSNRFSLANDSKPNFTKSKFKLSKRSKLSLNSLLLERASILLFI